MKIWLKSFGTGITMSIAAAIVFKQVTRFEKQYYTIEYTVESIADAKMSNGDYVKAMLEIPVIIKRRCDAAGYTAHIKPNKDNATFHITVENVDDSTNRADWITRQCKLEFFEVYPLAELQGLSGIFEEQPESDTTVPPEIVVPRDTGQSLIIGERKAKSIKSKPNEFSLDTLIHFSTNRTGDLGYVFEKDTAIVTRILGTEVAHRNLPAHIRFCYGPVDSYKRNKGKIWNLYAAFTDWSGVSRIQNKEVKSASWNHDRFGNVEVSFLLNAYGAHVWEQMTAKNKGRHIAILLDNVVLSAPIVNDVISGGSSVISGISDEREARAIAAELSGGFIKLPLKISSLQVIPQKSGNNWLFLAIIAGAFAFGSTIGWFVFNALRNR